jgi:hypothetical protein
MRTLAADDRGHPALRERRLPDADASGRRPWAPCSERAPAGTLPDAGAHPKVLLAGSRLSRRLSGEATGLHILHLSRRTMPAFSLEIQSVVGRAASRTIGSGARSTGVQADLSQAVDLSVEPVRAIARNSLAGSRRWDAPRDAPHSRVLERFANFASLFRCDAALREIVHDLIDVPLDGAGRVWLFLSIIVRPPPAHRRWTAATLRPQSGLRPALQGYHFDFGRSSAPFRRRSQPARSETGLRANAAPCKHQLPSACAIMR